MNALARHPDVIPSDGEPADAAVETGSAEPATLDGLSPSARSRVVRFIVTSTLERGAAPSAVIALYADLAGEPAAERYLDQRYVLRTVPQDWHELEDHVLDLEHDAAERHVDLAAAWRRWVGIAVEPEDVLEQLARLAGVPSRARHAQRSIFDDPEDLDELEDDADESRLLPLSERLPDLVDLNGVARDRIERFAVEERLEHGLAPIELLEMYRALETRGDERARQYLDRIFVDHLPPLDWQELQAEASRVMEAADLRGQDAGRLFSDTMRGAPGLDARTALRAMSERLLRR